jgi:hypothetical protein
MRAPRPSGGGTGGGQSFRPCPPGPQQAVCCDIIDLGIQPSARFKGKDGQALRQHKVRLKWQSSKLMSDGKPYVVSKQYTWSMDRRATLRRDLEAWRGRPFTDAEARDFDFESLLGVNCYLSVVHNRRLGKVYADVAGIMPCPKELPRLAVVGYTRQVDRQATAQRAPADQHPGADEYDQRNPGREPGDEYDLTTDDEGGHEPHDEDPPPF